MCGGSVPKDNSAEIARQQEAERNARIAEGQGKIDEAFTQFDDPFYQGREKSYADYYYPQLDDQYAETRRKLVLALSRTGNLNSGAGARQLGDLQEKYNTQRTAVADNALAAANEARAKVEAAKSDLYAQNRSAADPSTAATQAIAQSGLLASPTAYSPLGMVFADVINNLATATALNKGGFLESNSGTALFGTGSGSSDREKVVG